MVPRDRGVGGCDAPRGDAVSGGMRYPGRGVPYRGFEGEGVRYPEGCDGRGWGRGDVMPAGACGTSPWGDADPESPRCWVGEVQHPGGCGTRAGGMQRPEGMQFVPSAAWGDLVRFPGGADVPVLELEFAGPQANLKAESQTVIPGPGRYAELPWLDSNLQHIWDHLGPTGPAYKKSSKNHLPAPCSWPPVSASSSLASPLILAVSIRKQLHNNNKREGKELFGG